MILMSRKCIHCGQNVGEVDVYCINCGNILNKTEKKGEKTQVQEALPRDDIYAPLSVGDYLFIGFILMIPIINIIVFFIWAFDKYSNVNRRNLAKAGLIYLGICVALLTILGVGMFRAVQLDQQFYPEERYYEYDREFPDFDDWTQLPFDAKET
jgi:predicted nucleic acid-binding Zn ribbon protein